MAGLMCHYDGCEDDDTMVEYLPRNGRMRPVCTCIPHLIEEATERTRLRRLRQGGGDDA